MSKNNDNKIPRKDTEWIELCNWLELNIFGYDSDQHIQSKEACLVLKGLQRGQNTANNNQDSYGNYPYSIILLTFKANKVQILNSLKGKTFDSESRKMRYICAIVRDKINDVYLRYKKAQQSSQKTESINTDAIEYQGAEYKSQSTTKPNDKFKELW